jgi:hypothetical protein
MIELSGRLSEVKRDQEMESQIVSEVNAKKEPARLIARRQKQLKEEKKRIKKEQQLQQQQQPLGDDVAMEDEAKEGNLKKDADNAAMVVEDDSVSKDGNGSKAQHEEEELKKQLDDVVQSWRDVMGSRKLALELVANLCSGGDEEDEEGDGMEGGMYGDGDDEHMWDSDDEAKLMANTAMQSSGTAKSTSPYEQATYESLASHRLPEGILTFFKGWTQFIPAHGADEPPPDLVSQDVDELLATCAVCLGNLAACDALPTWKAATATVVSTGKSEENGLQLFWWELVSMLNLGGIFQGPELHMSSVMLSLLRSQPDSRALVDSTALDCIFKLLSTKQSSDGNVHTDALTQMHCNAISMLGVLCSEPHPESIDARVCAVLLERLRAANAADSGALNDIDGERSSIIITHEILNVLMDTYGADDCHEDVFAKEDVLGHFQRCLPGFRRRVKKAAKRDNSGEAGIWGETVLNASRFIKYKEGE